MLCIPTQIQVPTSHPEFASAVRGLLDRLGRLGLGTGDDPVQANGKARWLYYVSIPHRADDGSIEYHHLFQHPMHPVTGERLTVFIPASDGWWPDAGCRSLSPPRSKRQADLKLVS